MLDVLSFEILGKLIRLERWAVVRFDYRRPAIGRKNVSRCFLIALNDVEVTQYTSGYLLKVQRITKA